MNALSKLPRERGIYIVDHEGTLWWKKIDLYQQNKGEYTERPTIKLPTSSIS